MARRVFFSFHYQRDLWRVNQIRNSWLTQDREVWGFWDASLWEETKKKGDAAIKRLIEEGLKNTSVTAVLIGAETSTRKYVRYEIKRSYEQGKGLLGVYISSLKDQHGRTDIRGKNPFDNWYVERKGVKTYFSTLYPTYDWNLDRGYDNFGRWVERAAKAAGR